MHNNKFGSFENKNKKKKKIASEPFLPAKGNVLYKQF